MFVNPATAVERLPSGMLSPRGFSFAVRRAMCNLVGYVDLCCCRFKGQASLAVNAKEKVFTKVHVPALPATPFVEGLYPLRTSLNGHLWATLLPQKLPFSAIANKLSRKSKALVLIPHCGGRNRKRKTGVEHYTGPCLRWTLGKGSKEDGYYQRREELRGNKCKNRGPRRKRTDKLFFACASMTCVRVLSCFLSAGSQRLRPQQSMRSSLSSL